MTSTHASAPPTGPVVASVADAAGDLASAVDALAAADRETCRAVLALSRTIGTGVCETVEGLPPDLVLANLCRLIRADRSTILTAADVLRSMPATAGLWQTGVLSWGQVRNLCLRAAKLRASDREILDRRLAATAEDADAYGPDGLLDAVDRAVWDLEDAASAERAEERRDQGDFLSLQARLDGGVTLYGEYADPVRGATVTNALLDAAPPIDPDMTRGQRLAIGLATLAEEHLAGGPRRPAKPLIDVLVDLTQVTTNAAGTVDLHVDGPLATLTARTVEALTEDADLRVTLMDGARPLATAKKRTADRAPTDVRRAVALRDRGDRMPGSRAPLAWTDLHHTHEQAKGGDHHPDLLVNLRSRWHQLLHRRGWHNSLDPATGVFTIERDGRAYRSLPKGTPLRPDPGPDPPNDPPGDPPTDQFGDPLPF
ncbi:MAG: 13E12 repeat family protein [Actinobacteria bacterium]|nr:13E12 repeat family protein [Actinomycetota bacterium]